MRGFTKFMRGTDPHPEITHAHPTFGRDYLGFTLTGTYVDGDKHYLRFLHPSEMMLLVVDAPRDYEPEMRLQVLEPLILEDVRRLIN